MDNSIIMKTSTLSISSSNSIPEEIIIYEILKRLPVKTLCRFKVVSKRWLSIINSRPFIDSHFHRSKLKPTHLFVFYNKDTSTHHPPIFFSTNYPETSSYNLQNKDYRWCISSISPRGLICFYNIHEDKAVQIWNPSTGEHIEVNHPPRKLRRRCRVFLGFDTVSKKHKLLSSSNGESYIFTLGEKNWRKSLDYSSRNLTALHRMNCYIDGIIYWWARTDQNDDELVLVRFDVGSECFLDTIRLPELVRFSHNSYLRIYVYRGTILLLNWDDLPTNDQFRIWVLEDVEKQKWSPKRLIPRLPSLMEKYSFGFIEEEELIFYYAQLDANSEGDFMLCRYNLEKGSSWSETRIPELKKKLDRSAKYWMCLYNYVNTLESLKPLCD